MALKLVIKSRLTRGHTIAHKTLVSNVLPPYLDNKEITAAKLLRQGMPRHLHMPLKTLSKFTMGHITESQASYPAPCPIMTWGHLKEILSQAPGYVLEQEVILVFENRFWNSDLHAWQPHQERYSMCTMEAHEFYERYPRIQFKAKYRI